MILVAGAGGAFGGVLVASGIGNALAEALETIHLPLMPAAFLLSLVLRASQGSATVAILTTSGLLSQAVVGLEPLQLVLVTLATCFGSLGLSHVNDAGFWVVTRYLGLSVPDGLKTRTVLTTIMGVTGFLITAAVVLRFDVNTGGSGHLNFAPAQALTHYRCQTADPLPTASPG